MSSPELAPLVAANRREWVVTLVRQQVELARQKVRAGDAAPSVREVAEAATRLAEQLVRPAPQPVINATGVVIHTNLGRAPLSPEAIQAAALAARSYSNLEFDLERGRRGTRQAHLQSLLQDLTGAEAALVVNNNASAILLGLSALASGKQVIVSRGEAVEIGGGFRIPDVLLQSGAELVDVGTTNRTYLADYAAAVTGSTGAFLKAHASNFRVAGFTAEVAASDLARLGQESGIPVLYDVGSGCLLATERYGMLHEPTPQESVAAGVGLTFFSGDKLLGGPQAGIVVGSRELVARLERHPLARAVRIDKLSLAALIATLVHYLRGEAEQKVPVWRMISAPLQQVEDRACAWEAGLNSLGRITATVEASRSAIGGGSLPGETLPTRVLAVAAGQGAGGVEGMLRRLRQENPPIVGRIEGDRALFDPRTVLPEEDEALLRGLKAALSPARTVA